MPAGLFLSQRKDRYSVNYDGLTHVWRILDCWDKSLSSFTEDDDIPDSHQALKLIPESAFIQMIRKAEEVGMLESVVRTDTTKDDKIKKLEEELENQKRLVEDLLTDQVPPKVELFTSESFKLKQLAMNKILSIVGLGSVESINEN